MCKTNRIGDNEGIKVDIHLTGNVSTYGLLTLEGLRKFIKSMNNKAVILYDSNDEIITDDEILNRIRDERQ